MRLSNIAGQRRAFCQPAPGTVKKLLADQAATTKALVELKDRKPCWNTKPAWHSRASTKAFTVARSVYDAALQTQTDIQSFVGRTSAGIQQTAVRQPGQSLQNAGRFEVAINAVRTC